MKLGKYIDNQMNLVETENVNEFLKDGYKPIVENLKPLNESTLIYKDMGNFYLEIYNSVDQEL